MEKERSKLKDEDSEVLHNDAAEDFWIRSIAVEN